MKIEEIDKWLNNEYGVSYTRLEELHDFLAEQSMKYREKAEKEIKRLKGALQTHEILLQSNTKEIERLNNIINGLEKRLISDKKFFEDVYKKSHLSEEEFKKQCSYTIGSYDHCVEMLNKLQELKGSDKE